MKNLINLSLIALNFLVFVACNRPNDSSMSDNLLTKFDSIQIVDKIIEITDNYANAHNKLDVKGILDFWHYYNPDFIIFENSTIHPTNGEMEKEVEKFYNAGIDSTTLTWTRRDIIPISKEYAHLVGEYDGYLKFETGESVNVHYLYSALFKKINGNWKALRVHESRNTEE